MSIKTSAQILREWMDSISEHSMPGFQNRIEKAISDLLSRYSKKKTFTTKGGTHLTPEVIDELNLKEDRSKTQSFQWSRAGSVLWLEYNGDGFTIAICDEEEQPTKIHIFANDEITIRNAWQVLVSHGLLRDPKAAKKHLDTLGINIGDRVLVYTNKEGIVVDIHNNGRAVIRLKDGRTIAVSPLNVDIKKI